jgi:hypothetical protein
MFIEVDEKDRKLNEELKSKIEAKIQGKKLFGRILKYNEPFYMVFTAILGAMVHGSTMPIFAGVFMAKVLTLLSVPEIVLGIMYPN